MPKKLSYILTVVILASIVWGYFIKIHSLGFPDGHSTDYERAASKLYIAFTISGFLFACYFLYLAQIAKTQINTKRITFAIIVLLILGAVYMFSDWYLYTNLNHGQGG